MAKFSGSVQAFHHFIGPRVRNAVNNSTRAHRNQKGGTCESCGEKAELQSAHVHGRDRRTIIETVLQEFTDRAGSVSCELEEIERRILEAHLPIEETFRFLCQRCHVEYDARGPRPEREALHPKRPRGPFTITIGGAVATGSFRSLNPRMVKSVSRATTERDFSKISRIRLWADRPHQINHQIIRAFLDLEKNYGQVEYSDLRRYCTSKLGVRNFDGHYASMKTDAGNAHGKVFFNEGTKIKMWERVREEVQRYFPKKVIQPVDTNCADFPDQPGPICA